jgi:dienelactone hydrolase
MSDENPKPDPHPTPPPTQRASAPTSAARLSWGNRIARGALALVFLVGLFCSITPWGRAATRGVMLLSSVLSASQVGPVAASGEPIRYTSLTIPSRGGDVFLDVYEPAVAPPPIPGAREGVVIIPGVGDERGEGQLTNLTKSLARAGLVAMTMTTPTLIRYELSPVDSDAVVQAFLKLQHWPGVGADRVGILAFSAGNSLASLAAADPRIQHSIASLTFFGGFFNAGSLLRDVGRRALLVDGKLQPWQPDIVPLTVLANTLATTIDNSDAGLISDAFDFNDPHSLTPEQVAALSPPDAAAYHLLAGDQPDQVEANLAALTPRMNELLVALSPSSVVSQIRTPIYLLHDRSDQYVPFTESRDFAAALAHLHQPYQHVELSIFQHVEVRGGLGLVPVVTDGARLFAVLYKLLLPSV